MIRVAVVALLTFFLPLPTPADDLPDIQKRGTLRVLVEPDTLPELYAAKGAGGMEREVLEGFASLHKLKLETLSASFEDRIPALLKGRGDLVAGGLVASPARREQVAFTEEVLPTRLVVVTRTPHAPITTADQLKAARVGVVRGSAALEQVIATGVPRAQVEELPSETMLANLQTGKITAVVLSSTWAITEQRKDAAFKLGMFLGAPTAMAFALRKDQPLLKAALDQYIQNLRRTPTWSRLVVKYFGEAAREVLARARQ